MGNRKNNLKALRGLSLRFWSPSQFKVLFSFIIKKAHFFSVLSLTQKCVFMILYDIRKKTSLVTEKMFLAPLEGAT